MAEVLRALEPPQYDRFEELLDHKEVFRGMQVEDFVLCLSSTASWENALFTKECIEKE